MYEINHFSIEKSKKGQYVKGMFPRIIALTLLLCSATIAVSANGIPTYKSVTYQGQTKEGWTTSTFFIPSNNLFSLLTFIDEYKDEPSYLEVTIRGITLPVAKASGPYSSNNVKGISGEGVAFTGPPAEALRVAGPATITVNIYGKSRCLLTYELSQ